MPLLDKMLLPKRFIIETLFDQWRPHQRVLQLSGPPPDQWAGRKNRRPLRWGARRCAAAQLPGSPPPGVPLCQCPQSPWRGQRRPGGALHTHGAGGGHHHAGLRPPWCAPFHVFCGFRKDKAVPLKPAVDEALADDACPSVQDVVVVRRTETPITQ